MPRNSSGVYTPPASSVNPAVANTVIDPVAFNSHTTDFATGVTDSLDRQGRGGMTAVLAMGGFKITNVGTGVAATDAATVGNLNVHLPAGAIMDFGMEAAPPGWLVCDGAAVSRTTFAALFAAIGTVWGTGDGATTFNVPPLRGLWRRTWDNGAGVDAGRVFASLQQGGNVNAVPRGQASGTPAVSAGVETRVVNRAVQTCIKT